MKLAISAGGTGGHIFPGIAVAEAFAAHDAKNDVLFVGTRKGLESRIIPKAGFRLLFVEAHQFLGRSPIYKLLTLVRLMKGVVMSMSILRQERPDAILGMGGFTSVPVIIASVLLRIPTFLHEQNVQPGLANRLLARITKRTFVSFGETRQYLMGEKVRHTGNPLRKDLAKYDVVKRPGIFGIFIFGGSRGARSINDAVLELLPHLKGNKNVALYHQTGPEDFDRVSTAYGNADIDHEVFPFTNEMGKYYSLCDVVISRAGATTIFELACFKRAAILVPYPYSAGGHQWKNASLVEGIGGAYVIANEEATGETLFHAVKRLIDEPELLKEMGENMGKLYVHDAPERIIGGIEHGLS